MSASFFLFGVALLLAGEDDVGVETDVVVGLGLGASVFCIVARVLLAGPGLFLGLFMDLFVPDVPDGPATLLISSHGRSKSSSWLRAPSILFVSDSSLSSVSSSVITSVTFLEVVFASLLLTSMT